MELYQLEYFRVLCKHGNFTSASEELVVTQPAVSMAVKKLEDEFNAELIDRQDKGFSLTNIGEIVLTHAINIHNEVTGMREELEINNSRNKENIRLAAPLTMCSDLLRHLIPDLAFAHTNISLSFQQKGHAAIEEGLSKGTVDIGVLSKDMINPLLLYKDYAKVEFCVAFSHDHRFREYESITPQMLEKEKLLFSKEANRVPGYVRRYFEMHDIKPTCAYYNTFADDCARLAQQGLGVALAPRRVAGEFCAPLSPPLYCELVLAWNKKEKSTLEMQYVIEYIMNDRQEDAAL